MAMIFIEEILMGLDEVKVSLDNAVMVLEAITDDMAPRLEEIKTVLEAELLQPLQSRQTVLEQLLERFAAMG